MAESKMNLLYRNQLKEDQELIMRVLTHVKAIRLRNLMQPQKSLNFKLKVAWWKVANTLQIEIKSQNLQLELEHHKSVNHFNRHKSSRSKNFHKMNTFNKNNKTLMAISLVNSKKLKLIKCQGAIQSKLWKRRLIQALI